MPKIEKAFIQIYVILVLVLFAWNSVLTIRFPYGVDYGEAPLMDQVRRIETGETLYKSSINGPPYVIANYPPVYQLWVSGVNTLLHIPLFQSGRISTLFFSILSGSIIGLFSYHLTDNKWMGVFSAALFWGQPFVVVWSSVARVDMMALAFSLLGLYSLYRKYTEPVWIVIAVVCFLISAYTRQSYLLAGPLAGFIWLWNCNRKRALIFLAGLAFAGLAVFGIINAATHGGFYTNIVTANINRTVLHNAVSMFRQLFIIWPVVLIIIIILVILAIYSRFKQPVGEKTGETAQPFIYYGWTFFTIGAVISAMTVVKIGSNVNYFLELIAAGAVWGGLSVKLINRRRAGTRWLLIGLLLIQSLWVLPFGYQAIQTTRTNFWEKLDLYQNLKITVQAATQSGMVLSDDYMDMIVLADQRIYYQPFEYGELYYAGLWDPSALASQIEKRDFALIVIGGNSLEKGCCWPPTVINSIEANYVPEQSENVLIFEPMR